jgi:deoxyribodipyrimidine photo-lyase
VENSPIIIWFRKDLRLRDNACLDAAIKSGRPIIPLYIIERGGDERLQEWQPGAASNWWLYHALDSLKRDLKGWSGDLVVRSGESLEVLLHLVEESGANSVYWNRRYEGPQRELDAAIKRELSERGIEAKSFNSGLLVEPHTVATNAGQPYKVYTPFFKSVRDRAVDPPLAYDLEELRFPDEMPGGENLKSLGLLPRIGWDREMRELWSISEQAAFDQADRFLDHSVDAYAEDRDRPDLEGTSTLSPYLHFGQIGPRQIVHALKSRVDLPAKGPETFLKEIYWREFAHNVLYHFPHTANEPLRPEFKDFPWDRDETVLARWQKGLTGYPIVDAGMRQLWRTGWMHNRVRMIVASLLVKHLLHSWVDGAKWFWDTLVDADLASNTLGWQWSGGCGADAAPYFRVFNPIIQGQKFDPDGAYVKHYVPELEKLPGKYIHSPWEASNGVLSEAGVALGDSYPRPIIDHKKGRARALEAFDKFKSASD